VTKDVEARLAEVYHAASQTDLAKTYDNWAASYDADMLATGYAHPAVICGLTSRYMSDTAAPILDAGVGTGNIGNLLAILGFTNLHGLDMSQGMLAKARAQGVYTSLHQGVLGQALDFPTGRFSSVVSTGTFTTGHAPASGFDELARILKPGGFLIFTVGEPVWKPAGFAGKLESLCRAGSLTPVWQSAIYHPMPHSKTESGFQARAYVYQRA
jgi:predicted TPR repeat methyltransferase